MPNRSSLLKRAVLVFWAVWQTLAFVTNLADVTVSRRHPGWPAASGNYAAVQSAGARVGAPRWLGALLFAGLLFWQAAAAGLFWRAALHYRADRRSVGPHVNEAFLAGLGLWAALLVTDEFFVTYETGAEASHMRAFTAQLASLLSLHLLPDASDAVLGTNDEEHLPEWADRSYGFSERPRHGRIGGLRLTGRD